MPDKPVATVIIPTFDHGESLRFAVQTALWQTLPVEVFIIGDGVPERSRTMIEELTAQNPSIYFFDHPKHERRGEPYRHSALTLARGDIVCYLCDRDLWMPDHVSRMASLLEDAEFAHSLALHVMPGRAIKYFGGDIALPEYRWQILNQNNFIPLSCAAHRLDFYRTLAEGWTTTPDGKPTDWHMFQKFLRRADCRAVSGTRPTALTFPSSPRKTYTEQQRVSELKQWLGKIDTTNKQLDITSRLLEGAIRARDYSGALTLRAQIKRISVTS